MNKRAVWKDEFYLQAYLLTLAGETDDSVRKIIGASEVVWKRWKANRSALRAALAKARQARRDRQEQAKEEPEKQSFADYVFGHLPKEMRRLWSEIESLEDNDQDGQDAIRSLLANSGKRFRQGLFIYALTRSRFNVTEAMQRAMISLDTYDKWIRQDADFEAMVKEIAFHRKNYFENALLRQIDQGDTQAIIFANKTQNRDRGYGDQLDVSVSGNISHTHVILDLEQLEIPTPVLRQMLDACKRKRADEDAKELDATFQVSAAPRRLT
jgi:hypothetical protein